MKRIDKIVGFFAGFFTDKNGKPSRKAATLYICLFFFYTIIIGGGGKELNVNTLTILGVLLVIILYCLNAITKEQVGNLTDKIIDKDE